MERFLHYRLVLSGECAEESRVGRASHAYQLPHREVVGGRLVGEHHGEEASQLLWGVFHQGLAEEADFAKEGRLEGGECAEQGGFAHAIGSYQTGEFATLQMGADVLGDDLSAVPCVVADAKLLQCYRRLPVLRFFHANIILTFCKNRRLRLLSKSPILQAKLSIKYFMNPSFTLEISFLS